MANEVNSNPINYTQELTLDLNSNNAYTTVFAKQYDSARYLKIYLTKDNIPYPIDATHSFYFRMRKPDGHGVINPAFVKINDVTTGEQGYVTVQLTEQCLAVAGRGYADLVEYDSGGSVLSSIPFILNVMSSPNLGENIVSNDEFQQLAEMVAHGDALLKHAPQIELDPTSEHYLEWMWYNGNNEDPDDQGEYIYSGVIAQGQDGVDGAAAGFGNIIANIDDTSGDPSVEVVVDSQSPSTAKSFTFNFTGLKGEQGEVGPRGLPGAGGVTWVDGIEASDARKLDDTQWIQIGSANSVNISNTRINLSNASFVSDFDFNSFINIAFTSDNNEPSDPSIKYAVTWDSAVVPSYVDIIASTTETLPSMTTYFLWGQKGITSGNVILDAVAYSTQLILHNFDAYGNETSIEITPEMKAIARDNIDAIGGITNATNGDILTYTSAWTNQNLHSLLNGLNYDDLNVIIQNYSYTAVNSQGGD